MKFFPTVLIISIGATVGASLRYYIGVWMTYWLGKSFPYGTLTANIIGSFIAGVLLVLIIEKSLLSESYKLLLLVGLCGSLTTFSAFSLETIALFHEHNYTAFGLNILLNLALSLAGVVVGATITRYLLA